MDTAGLAMRAEITWIRIRGWLRAGLRMAGLGLVFLVLFNLAAPMFTTHAAFAPYRRPLMSVLSLTPGAAYVTDVLVLGVGLVVAWWG